MDILLNKDSVKRVHASIDEIDKSIKIIETNRGGKITCHGPGQLICYFVLDLRNKKDIRKFINSIERVASVSLDRKEGVKLSINKENIQ